MHIQDKPLKPLASIQLSADENKILQWMRGASWEAQADARDPIPYKAKVPEFFGGVRLYRMQSGGGGASHNALELFIKKLEFQGCIARQELYPLTVEGGARFLSLKKAELDNLGVGREAEDEDE